MVVFLKYCLVEEVEKGRLKWLKEVCGVLSLRCPERVEGSKGRRAVS